LKVSRSRIGDDYRSNCSDRLPKSKALVSKTLRLDRYSIIWLFFNQLVYKMRHQPQLHASGFAAPEADTKVLDLVFSALADPVRRAILGRLDGHELLVSELAAPFAISLQAVSKHIQVLVKAGLVTQERSGRISRCRLQAGPIYQAAVWINRYAKYWQKQFDLLAVVLEDMEQERARKPASRKRHRKRSPGKHR
jgi:DNA-binding transcriptional ArsR family regulator